MEEMDIILAQKISNSGPGTTFKTAGERWLETGAISPSSLLFRCVSSLVQLFTKQMYSAAQVRTWILIFMNNYQLSGWDLL